MTSAAVGGFAAGAVSAGSIEGGAQGAFSASLFFQVGDFLNAQGLFVDGYRYGEDSGIGIAAHGVAGCVSSVVGGSKCGPGALSAAFSQVALPYKPTDDIVGATVASMVIGGTASSLGGGKFWNGAKTAAFGYLFNHCTHNDCFGQRGGGGIPSPGAIQAQATSDLAGALDRFFTRVGETLDYIFKCDSVVLARNMVKTRTCPASPANMRITSWRPTIHAPNRRERY